MDDQPATVCAHCGASLTGGRFCTNCGARIGTVPAASPAWSSPTDTAERRYDVLEQPPVTPAPPVDPTAMTPTVQRAVPPILPPPPPPTATAPTAPTHSSYTRQSPGAGLWVGAAVVMLVVLLLGGFLLLHGSSGGSTSGDATPPLVPKTQASTQPTAEPSSQTAESSSPSASASIGGRATNVAGLSQASAPAHAPGGVDFAGRPVSYVAPNMVDGITDTCWRTSGDATGMVLTFRLDRPTRLTRVGLINGYAKIAYDGGRRFDWYLGNRRILAVDWIFDDGTTVSQQLSTNRAMQQTAIKPVTTDVVRLRITAVSPPGKGRAARDDTAISEVLLIGHAD